MTRLRAAVAAAEFAAAHEDQRPEIWR